MPTTGLPRDFKVIKNLKVNVFLVEDRQGQKYAWKKDGVLGKRLVQFSKTAGKNGKNLASLVPPFYTDGKGYWDPFYKGEKAGDTLANFGFTLRALGHISPEVLGKALWELQTLKLPKKGLDKRGAGFYLKNLWEVQHALETEFSPRTYLEVETFLRSRAKLVDRHSKYLANGDLHPQNFILLKKAGFVDVDWDLLHMDNFAYDLALPYVWAWRSNPWQEKFIKAYLRASRIDKNLFDQVFAFNAVYLSAQLIKHAGFIKAKRKYVEAQKKILGKYLR